MVWTKEQRSSLRNYLFSKIHAWRITNGLAIIEINVNAPICIVFLPKGSGCHRQRDFRTQCDHFTMNDRFRPNFSNFLISFRSVGEASHRGYCLFIRSNYRNGKCLFSLRRIQAHRPDFYDSMMWKTCCSCVCATRNSSLRQDFQCSTYCALVYALEIIIRIRAASELQTQSSSEIIKTSNGMEPPTQDENENQRRAGRERSPTGPVRCVQR